MKSQEAKPNGFVIIFVLMFVSTLSLAAFYMVGSFTSSSRDQLKLNTTNTAQMIRNHVHNLAISRTAWANTVADTGNVEMACLRTNTDCVAATPYNFRLRDANNTVVFNPYTGTSGFRTDGTVCNTFNDLVGDDDCPFSLTLTWEATCGVPATGAGEGPVSYTASYGCKYPMIRIRSNVKYHPANIGLQVAFSTSTFSETFDFSGKQSAGAAGVAGYMVKWTAARELGPSTVWANPAGTRVGIGTAAPALPLEVIRDSRNPAGRHTASFEAYSGTPNVNGTSAVAIGAWNSSNNYANAVVTSIQGFNPNTGAGRDLFFNPAGGNVVMTTNGVPNVTTAGLRIQGTLGLLGNDPFSAANSRGYHSFALHSPNPQWEVFSDRRLKKNIQPFVTGVAELMKLQPKFFKFNGLAETPTDNKDHLGFIAQDLIKDFPYMVSKHNLKLRPSDSTPTEILMVDANPTVFLLINALKDLSRQIEAKISDWIAKTQSLESKIRSEEARGILLLRQIAAQNQGSAP